MLQIMFIFIKRYLRVSIFFSAKPIILSFSASSIYLSSPTVFPFKAFTCLNKSKALKVGSVMANIGISCLFLGYIVPKAVYKYREWKTGSTKFHVAEDIKNNKKDI